MRAFARTPALLLTTDVAARCLDFPGIDWVIQDNRTEDVEAYVYCAGLTARYNAANGGGETNELLLNMKVQADQGSKGAAMNPKSPAAVLGKSCLPPVLAALASATDNDAEGRRRCTKILSSDTS